MPVSRARASSHRARLRTVQPPWPEGLGFAVGSWMWWSGVPYGGFLVWKRNDRPPHEGVGPVSLWLPASSSDQLALADQCLPDVWLSCSRPWVSWWVSSSVPCQLLTVAESTTESGGPSSPRIQLWRASHTLVGMEPLIDPFGRRVTDLRVSITDRCNFRCTYCMP